MGYNWRENWFTLGYFGKFTIKICIFFFVLSKAEADVPLIVSQMFSYEAGFPYNLLQIWQSQQAHQGSTEASTSKLQTTHL